MFCPECGNLAANKALQKLGVKDESKVLTYDGNNKGKESFEFEGTPFVRIGEAVAFDSITMAFVTSADYGLSEVWKKYMTATADPNGDVFVSSAGVTAIWIITSGKAAVSNGTYVLSTADMYVSRIETEAFHPIDQKYLPGVCLPVVEINGEMDETGVSCSEAESAALDAVAETGLPAVLKIAAIGSSVVVNYTFTEGAFICAMGNEIIIVSKTENGWFLTHQII